MKAYPMRTICGAAAALAIALCPNLVQAQGRGVSAGVPMGGQRGITTPTVTPQSSNLPVPLNPMGLNLGAFKPAVPPIPFDPRFPTSQPVVTNAAPVIVVQPVILQGPPVMFVPAEGFTAPQMPMTAPSAPMMMMPSAPVIFTVPLEITPDPNDPQIVVIQGPAM